MEQMPSSKDRPAEQPGGVECEICGVIFIGAEWHGQVYEPAYQAVSDALYPVAALSGPTTNEGA